LENKDARARYGILKDQMPGLHGLVTAPQPRQTRGRPIGRHYLFV